MTIQKQDSRLLPAREWKSVELALREARFMVNRTATHLTEIYKCLAPGSDARVWTPAQKTTVNLFRRHFKSDSSVQAVQIQQGYRAILSHLNMLQQPSFRIVGNALAHREGEGDDYAYVRQRTLPIYLAEAYFGGGRVTLPGGRSVGADPLTDIQQARLLIHVAAHLALGVEHRGGCFGLATECEHGYPVQSFVQAADNAFVFDHFAVCAGQ
jgi:hypothetical protein